MEKLKIGIVGAGVWGETHAFIFNEHIMADLVAICDVNQERAQKIADQYGIKEVYTDYREMAEKSSMQAVSIVTPDFLHADVACCMADHGKHMLIEKPLATTRPDIDRIVEAVERNNVRCMVDLHNRWSAPFNVCKQQIDSGKLGTPWNAYIRHNDIKWVATDMIKWAADSSILWFLGSHSLDALRWMFDDEVKRVYSVKREGILHKLGVNTADAYFTTIEFMKGGIAQMENGWVTPNGNTNINDFRFSILGTEGMVSIDASSHNLISMVDDNRAYTPDVLVFHKVFGRTKGLSYESIRDFVDRMVDGEPFRVTLKDARNTAIALIAIHESADKGGVPIDLTY